MYICLEVGRYGCHFDGHSQLGTMVRDRRGGRKGRRKGGREEGPVSFLSTHKKSLWPLSPSEFSRALKNLLPPSVPPSFPPTK